MMLVKTLVISLMLIIGYGFLFLPALLIWAVANKVILRNAIARVKHKKTVRLATLFVLIAIELGCLFYINAHPFVVYDKTTISDELAEKVLTYVHSDPERFLVEDFAGYRLSEVTFKFKEEISIVNGNGAQINYSISSIPYGENHWTFFVEDNELSWR